MSFDSDQALLDLQPPFEYITGRVISYTPTSFSNPSYTISLDLQEALSITMKNFIKANWPPNSILRADQIKFGTKWNNSFGSYQIHFQDSSINDRPLTISWQMVYISHMIDIRLWVRKNSLTRPAELDDMKRAINYIVHTNRTQFPIALPYSSFIRVVRMIDMTEGQPLETLWRSVITLEVRYHRASSN